MRDEDARDCDWGESAGECEEEARVCDVAAEKLSLRTCSVLVGLEVLAFMLVGLEVLVFALGARNVRVRLAVGVREAENPYSWKIFDTLSERVVRELPGRNSVDSTWADTDLLLFRTKGTLSSWILCRYSMLDLD